MLIDRIKKEIGNEYKGCKKCAVGYSGGLDSTAMLLLLEELGIDTVAVVLNIGQGEEKYKTACERAKKHATHTKFYDVREDLYRNLCRGIKANAILEGHVNSEGLSRPLIALYLVKVAAETGCDMIAHGSSGTGNDQHRMENALRVLAPDKKAIAPVRDWNLLRDECQEYLVKKGINEFKSSGTKYPISSDESLWARTIRIAGKLEQVPIEAYKWTEEVEKAPDKKVYAEVEFDCGCPVSVEIGDGKKKSRYTGYKTLEELNKVAGKAGYGRMNTIEDKVIGFKMQEAYEAPGALALVNAHHELERLVLTSDELYLKDFIDHSWNKLIYDGGFYTRLRLELDAFIEKSQEAVSGRVKMAFYKGGMEITSRQSPNALYDVRMASRDKFGVLNQKDARYFSKLYGLQDSLAFMIGKD